MLKEKSELSYLRVHFTHEGDTGSPEVQLLSLQRELMTLQSTSKVHKEDHHSREVFLKMVGQKKQPQLPQ